jgi:hypothetical protein
MNLYTQRTNCVTCRKCVQIGWGEILRAGGSPTFGAGGKKEPFHLIKNNYYNTRLLTNDCGCANKSFFLPFDNVGYLGTVLIK